MNRSLAKLRVVVGAFIGPPVLWIFARLGRDIIRRDRYGYDPFLDIERLSRLWRYPIDLFLDVGANDGGTIRLAKRRFGNCRIIAFEPHPKTFLKLTENTTNIQNLELVNVALGCDVGKKTMYEYDLSVVNSLIPDAQFAVRFGAVAGQIEVPCTTIDKFCEERGIRQIDVLKIDTEGFDLEVLKGANSMLASNAIRFIYFEFNEVHPRKDSAGGALAPIDQLIRPHGYRFIASYNDYVVTDGEPFLVCNALYVLPPRPSTNF